MYYVICNTWYVICNMDAGAVAQVQTTRWHEMGWLLFAKGNTEYHHMTHNMLCVTWYIPNPTHIHTYRYTYLPLAKGNTEYHHVTHNMLCVTWYIPNPRYTYLVHVHTVYTQKVRCNIIAWCFMSWCAILLWNGLTSTRKRQDVIPHSKRHDMTLYVIISYPTQHLCHVSNVTRNSQKSASYSIYYMNWQSRWRLRISARSMPSRLRWIFL